MFDKKQPTMPREPDAPAMRTRDKIMTDGIADAVSSAFAKGSKRASDGSDRPTLTNEDCHYISCLAYAAM